MKSRGREGVLKEATLVLGLAAAGVNGVADTNDETNAHKNVDGDEVPEGGVVDDGVALVFVGGEGPGLSNDPPGEHEDEEEAEDDGHEKGTAAALRLDASGFLDTDFASEGGDERDEEEDELNDAAHEKPDIDGLLAGGTVGLLGIRAVDGEGNNEPNAHGKRYDRLDDRTANLKAVRTQ